MKASAPKRDIEVLRAADRVKADAAALQQRRALDMGSRTQLDCNDTLRTSRQGIAARRAGGGLEPGATCSSKQRIVEVDQNRQ